MARFSYCLLSNVFGLLLYHIHVTDNVRQLRNNHVSTKCTTFHAYIISFLPNKVAMLLPPLQVCVNGWVLNFDPSSLSNLLVSFLDKNDIIVWPKIVA